MKTLKGYEETALKVVKEAGNFLLENFGNIKSVTHKSIYHWGIKEDLRLNKFYEDKFRQLTPEASLYTEEGEKNLEKELVWVVDPIEGTSNYRVGNPFYATQVCLLKEKEPVVGVVYAPTLKQMFTAIKDKGVYLNDKRVKVSNIKELNQSIIAIGKGTKYDDLLWYSGIMNKILIKCRAFRNYGATGLELSYTACGMIDVYVNKGSQIYDYSSGVLMVREAGGIVTDFNGSDWNIKEDSLIASNKNLNKQVVDVFKS